jgi:hypothetical protein
MNNIIKFSTNWNNKLDCNYFTTLRISDKYANKKIILIEFKGKYRVCDLVECRKLNTLLLNDFMCYLDAGYNRDETIKILENMYKFDSNTEVKTIYLYLLKGKTKWLSIDDQDILDLM